MFDCQPIIQKDTKIQMIVNSYDVKQQYLYLRNLKDGRNIKGGVTNTIILIHWFIVIHAFG